MLHTVIVNEVKNLLPRARFFAGAQNDMSIVRQTIPLVAAALDNSGQPRYTKGAVRLCDGSIALLRVQLDQSSLRRCKHEKAGGRRGTRGA